MAAQAPIVLDVRFVTEARALEGLPVSGGLPSVPELAIAGRSNVGKSTLINGLLGRRDLARTSKTPGRTRGIIFYEARLRPAGAVEPLTVRIADLPGYGYAKVAKDERLRWGDLVEGYIEHTRALVLALVLVDARRGFDDEDRQLLEWLRAVGHPICVVATKIDKLSASERGLCSRRFLAELGAVRARVLPVSAESREGLPALWEVVLRAFCQRETT